MGSFHFARRYFGNRCFFLFLRLLRCFSSPGSLPCTMDSCMGGGGMLRRVSPFRYLRINGYLHLPAAFRSLSRLSSALSAKASTLRSWSFNLFWLSCLFPFASSVMLLGVPELLFGFSGLCVSGLFSQTFSVNLFRFTEVNLFTNLPLGCLVYLVCKLDNKICSIFGFQGTGGNHFVITS